MTMGSGEYPPALLSISGSPVSSENIMAHSGCSTSAEVQANQRNLCFRTDFKVFFFGTCPGEACYRISLTRYVGNSSNIV